MQLGIIDAFNHNSLNLWTRKTEPSWPPAFAEIETTDVPHVLLTDLNPELSGTTENWIGSNRIASLVTVNVPPIAT